MQHIGFIVESKNLSFTLSGHFLNRCGIKSLCHAPSWTHGFKYKSLFYKSLSIGTVAVGLLVSALPSPVMAFDDLSSGLNGDQQACFSLAMVGMDSVINSRLGVPPEHALALASLPVVNNSEPFDTNLLKVILGAYLWQETPHSYAIKVFYGCAAESSYRKQAKIN